MDLQYFIDMIQAGKSLNSVEQTLFEELAKQAGKPIVINIVASAQGSGGVQG
jgi:hypothetical protein